MRFVCHHPGARASLVLLEAKRGAKAGLTLEEDLFLFTPSGEKTADYNRLYHEES